MKLKKVDKDTWQKCCRWCHNYQKGKCYKNHTDVGEDLSVYKVAEEGYLEETIGETLGSCSLDEFKELEYLLRGFKLSEKRIKEFDDLFRRCWEYFSQNKLKFELEENVAECYQNHLTDFDSLEGETILNPEEHCCKDWC